jgi:hypothetical protein
MLYYEKEEFVMEENKIGKDESIKAQASALLLFATAYLLGIYVGRRYEAGKICRNLYKIPNNDQKEQILNVFIKKV